MVLEKKEEVTALEMRLQALDKDLDWKKEVTAFFAIKVYTNTVEPLFDEPVYSVTSLLGYSTAFQGTPPFRGHKIWSRRNVQIIFVFVISIEGTPLSKERDTFLGSRNPDLTSIQGTP